MSWRDLVWGWSGRINRLQYFVVLLAFSFALRALTYIWAPFPSGLLHSSQWMAAWGLTILSVVVISPLLVRRSHDIGLQGWWVAALFALGMVSTQIAYASELFWVHSAIGAPGALALFGGFLVPGQNGANRFGPQPEAGLPKRW